MARSAEATAANRRVTGRVTDDPLVVVEGSVAVLGEVEGPVEVEVLGVVTVQKGNTPVAKNGFPFFGVVEVDLATVVVTGALVVVGAIVVDAVEGVPLVVVTGALVVVGVAVVFVVTGALVVVGAAVVFVVTGALVVVTTVVSTGATFRGKQISKVNSIGCTILPETYVEYQSAAACS